MSRLMLIAPVLASIALTSIAQLTLKIGMSSEGIQRLVAEQNLLRTILAVISCPMIIFGLSCYVLSAAAWLIAIATLDLSTAYPLVALTIVITVAASHFLLGETVSSTTLAGMFAIIVGVVLIGSSVQSSRKPTNASRAGDVRETVAPGPENRHAAEL